MKTKDSGASPTTTPAGLSAATLLLKKSWDAYQESKHDDAFELLHEAVREINAVVYKHIEETRPNILRQ